MWDPTCGEIISAYSIHRGTLVYFACSFLLVAVWSRRHTPLPQQRRLLLASSSASSVSKSSRVAPHLLLARTLRPPTQQPITA
ncbi:hypothetical protein UPYG_G00191860 [Umbra pygmaea]|uniref:Uncharacterized protein n=1 Tax=Umbra pygmaea TaxID=75934 RepID=A0ABD0WTB5_UMBPY